MDFINAYWGIIASIFFIAFFILIFIVRKNLIAQEDQTPLEGDSRFALSQEQKQQWKKENVENQRDIGPEVSMKELVNGSSEIKKETVYGESAAPNQFILKKSENKKSLNPFEGLVKNLIDSGNIQAVLETDIGEKKAFGLKWKGQLKLNSKQQQELIDESFISQTDALKLEKLKDMVDDLKPDEQYRDEKPKKDENIIYQPEGGYKTSEILNNLKEEKE